MSLAFNSRFVRSPRDQKFFGVFSMSNERRSSGKPLRFPGAGGENTDKVVLIETVLLPYRIALALFATWG